MVHGNARLAPKGCWEMVKRVKAGASKSRVAREMGVSRECVRKWMYRYDAEGEAGLLDRSSRPRSSPRRAGPEEEQRVVDARRRLRAGPARIAAATGTAERTVTRILRRNGVLRLWDCDPLSGELKQPLRKGSGIRFERPCPGDLLHMDTKKIAVIFPPAGDGPCTGGETSPSREWAMSSCTPSSTTTPDWPTPRPLLRRESPDRGRVPHPGVGELPATRHPPHPGDNDRQPPKLPNAASCSRRSSNATGSNT